MDDRILIAAPIYRRAWILPKWIELIEKQNYPKEKLGFLFELGPDDDETHDILWEWQTRSSYSIFDAQVQMTITHHEHEEFKRSWCAEKYINMVELRNSLLERATVMSANFDWYFSLDSDLLLENPETLNVLLSEAKKGRDVVSPLSYMTPHDTDFPSAMSWETNMINRAGRKKELYKIGETFKADVVMAAVFMSKDVYTNARYRWHQQGEDIGFAVDLKEKGFQSYCVWELYCPHIMHRYMLNDYIKMGFDGRKPF